MNKKINGYELIKMLQEGKIKEGTLIKDYYNTYIYEKNKLTDELILFIKNSDTCRTVPDYSFFADNDNEFEILEDEKEIDIQDIKIFELPRDLSIFSNDTLSKNQRSILEKVNMLVKAVKQLDKKINKED